MVVLLGALAHFLYHDQFLLHMLAASYYLLCAVYTVGVVANLPAVSQLLRLHDLLCGHAMFLPLFFLAALQLPDKIQTWYLPRPTHLASSPLMQKECWNCGQSRHSCHCRASPAWLLTPLHPPPRTLGR